MKPAQPSTPGPLAPGEDGIGMSGEPVRMPRSEAIPILTDEVDVFWEFDDTDTRHDPSVKHLRPESPRSVRSTSKDDSPR